MTPDRCRHCGAAVPPAAAWCSLCFGRLSADPEPDPEPDSEPDPLTAPLSVLEPQVEQFAAAPAPEPREPLPAYAETTHASPVSVAERPAGWPCNGCHALVPLELMACPMCGAPFLPSDTAVSLPVVGDPRSLSTGMKVAIMAGGSAVVSLVVFLLFLVLGSLF